MPTALSGASNDRTILVVEDDRDQRTAVAELLTRAGYHVVVACDGQDAMELLRAGLRPAVIVLDLSMPRMTGWTFLERLRAGERSSVPVLVTSGDARERPPAGADACLDKPVDGAVFRAVVGRLLALAGRQLPHA